MKRIAIICLLNFLFTGIVCSQKYILDAEVRFYGSIGDAIGHSFEAIMQTTTGKWFELPDFSMKRRFNAGIFPLNMEIDIADGYIDKMMLAFTIEQRYVSTWGAPVGYTIWNNPCEGSAIIPDLYNVYSSNGCISPGHLNQYIPGRCCGILYEAKSYDLYLDEIQFTKFDYYPKLNISGSPDAILPDDDAIVITADDGFPVNAYKWQYGTLDSVYFSAFNIWRVITTWHDIPSNYYTTKNRLVVSGRQLLGNNIDNYCDKNVSIRIDFGCNLTNPSTNKITTTNMLTYTVRRTAPHIVNVEYEQETCYKSNDAKIIITFDRALTPQERLYISLNGNEFREKGTVVINANKQTEINNVSAGTYNIALIGVYDKSATDTVNLYTGHASHKWDNFKVEERSPLSATITPSDVHCKNGKDGQIEVSMSGGLSPYTATLSKGTSLLDEQTFSKVYSFNDLDSSFYTIAIKDVNNCVNDISEQPLIRNIPVTQPSDTVQIYVIDFDEAHGYGRSTGWAEVGARGGSEGYNFTWEKQNPITEMTQTGGTAASSRLENLPTDWYLATVKDQNYGKAFPQIEINTRGCIDTVSIFIDQPPRLITEISETHIVTCHGDNDGQLLTHTTGGRPFNPAQDAGRTLPYNLRMV